MGATSRTKGAQFERKVARMFREALPHQAEHIRRGLQGNGAWEADISVPGLWLELKKGTPARYPEKALVQAERDSEKAGVQWRDICVAVCEEDRKTATATLRLASFVSLFATQAVIVEPMTLTTIPLTAFIEIWAKLGAA